MHTNKLSRGQQLTTRADQPNLRKDGSKGSQSVEIVKISSEAAGQRIDNFLLARLKGVPRSRVYKLLRGGEVRVNKGRVKPAYRLSAGDLVRVPPVRRPEAGSPALPSSAVTARLAAAVLYEDDRVLVIDKPSGLAVHGGSGIGVGVIEALRAMRPGQELELVHRLDRETSGCLVIGKRRSALRALHRQLREGEVTKRYRALLAGSLPRRVVEVTLPLRKFQLRGGERMVQVDPEAGKPARTVFRRAEAYGGATLTDVELYTGRTHQIRVHAASLGAPVAGDEKYGSAEDNRAFRELGLKRLFLHAAALSFRPREDGDTVRVEAPLPPELQSVLEKLAGRR